MRPIHQLWLCLELQVRRYMLSTLGTHLRSTHGLICLAVLLSTVCFLTDGITAMPRSGSTQQRLDGFWVSSAPEAFTVRVEIKQSQASTTVRMWGRCGDTWRDCDLGSHDAVDFASGASGWTRSLVIVKGRAPSAQVILLRLITEGELEVVVFNPSRRGVPASVQVDRLARAG